MGRRGVREGGSQEDRKAALLVALRQEDARRPQLVTSAAQDSKARAGLSEGRKVVLALQAGARESQDARRPQSTESWGRPSVNSVEPLLRDLQARGLPPPRLVIGDGHLGIWAALRGIYPQAKEQRCWNHRIVNVLDRIGRRDQPAARELLRQVAYAPTLPAAERNRRAFQAWGPQRGYPEAGRLLDQDGERMLTFYRFPQEHWGHVRTTNPVESPFAALRLWTVAAKRFKKMENATAVIWKLLLLAERRIRRLNALELLAEVWKGTQFVDGVRVPDHPQQAAA